jgi:NADPH-dependent glutamate synthase beta subunit-like oxidoreductase
MDVKRVRRSDFIVPRCTDACPAGVDVPRYIRAVKNQRYDEAVAVLREKIPFPTVCADACFAPCEEVCAYRQFGDPIAIRDIKRAAVDNGGDTWKKRKKVADKTGKKVAIVGAGPAGLAAAYYLASKGHGVTVYDVFPKPGGTMRYGIPKYRLPEDRLDKDVNDILEWGVTFKGNTTIGKGITLDQLKKDFDAIFVASGANGSIKIPLEGVEMKGVLWGWDFLRDVGLGETFDFKGDVIVVGGGNVAIDVALTAKRMGAENVHLYCLEKREEMPAHEWEISRAEEEGVFIHNSWGPRKVLGEETVAGLGLIKCTSVFDKEGNFNPTYDEEVTDKMWANHIILAVGQTADLAFIESQKDIKASEGRIQVKETDFATGEEGIFAGGDVVSGPQSIISAIAHGRKVAASIDKHLGGDGNIDEALATPEGEVAITPLEGRIKPRAEMPLLDPASRITSFEQVELGLNKGQAIEEARRCLECDAREFEVVVYPENCKECGYCVEVCGLDVFAITDWFNAKGYRPAESRNPKMCVGCLQCFYACPDYAIDVKEITG